MTESDTQTTATSGPDGARHTVERYVAFWNAATPAEQRRLAAAVFADRISYHATVGVLRGVDALIDFRDRFAEHAPGYRFQPRSTPQTHHDRARLPWELIVDGTSFATGTDVLELDDRGYVVAVTSFLDQAPEGFTHADH